MRACASKRSTTPSGDCPPTACAIHICWGSWHGPHTTDVPLRDIVDIILGVNGGRLLVEAANPRHEHEYHVWEKPILAGKFLIPGVMRIRQLRRAPELVAERLVRYASIVGRENVVAGVDAASARAPSPAASRRACGRSSACCGRARTWRASGSGTDAVPQGARDGGVAPDRACVDDSGSRSPPPTSRTGLAGDWTAGHASVAASDAAAALETLDAYDCENPLCWSRAATTRSLPRVR